MHGELNLRLKNLYNTGIFTVRVDLIIIRLLDTSQDVCQEGGWEECDMSPLQLTHARTRSILQTSADVC
jgi:hypothetical protein